MFHLQAGVHFEEIEVAIRIDHELHGARALIVAGPSDFDGHLAHLAAHVFADDGTR